MSGNGVLPLGPGNAVLHNQELASLIAKELQALVNPRDSNKKSLVGLATLNSSFFHAITDELWRDMPSASPFWRLLLPLSQFNEQSEALLASPSDPWARFRFYHRKTVRLCLEVDNEILQKISATWATILLQHPTAPSRLFPKLVHIAAAPAMKSGINSVLPLYVSFGLREATLPGEKVVLSDRSRLPMDLSSLHAWLAVLQQNSPSLHCLVFRNPLTPKFFAPLARFKCLTTLTLSLPCPYSLYEVAGITRLSPLTHLTLQIVGPTGYGQRFPENHLERVHDDQGKAKIVELTLIGDPGSMFWGTAFFASPHLRRYAAHITKSRPGSSTILVSWFSIHVLSVRSINLESLRIINHLPFTDLSIVAASAQDHTFGPGFLDDFSKLVHLRALEIIDVPFVDLDVIGLLLNRTHTMKHLRSLCLRPRPRSNRPEDALRQLGLRSLSTIASMHPSLEILSIPIAFTNIPPPLQNHLNTPPNSPHRLKKLFCPISNWPQRLSMADSISLSKYLHSVFPHLHDVTSQSPAPESITLDGVPAAKILSDPFWDDIEPLLKLLQETKEKH